MEKRSFSQFPHNITLKEIRKIASLKEFGERTRDGCAIFNYHMGKVNTFPDPFEEGLDEAKKREYMCRREMRGLIFNNSTCELLCRPYHKFFNDETDELIVAKKFEKSKKFLLLEKLDGMFISGMLDNTVDPPQIRFVSKTGYQNKNGKKVSKFVRKATDVKYIQFVTHWCQKGFSPIFEFIESQRTRVVKYDKVDLILTALRNLYTGEYVDYEETVKSAVEYNVPCVKATIIEFNNEKKSRFEQLMGFVKSRENIEGFCLRLDNGDIFKMKTLYYVQKGRGNADLAFQEHYIWKLILRNDMDDFKANVAKKALRKRIDRYHESLMDSIYSLEDEMKSIVKDFKKVEKSEDVKLHEFAEKIGLEKSGLKFKLLRIMESNGSEDGVKLVVKFILEHSSARWLDSTRKLLKISSFY